MTTRVRLVGVEHWCRHLAALLSEADDQLDIEVVRPGRLRPSFRRTTVRVGFRPGATTWRGRIFDAVWAISVRPSMRCTYWIGTDVIQSVQDGEPGPLSRRWRRWLAGRSAVGAPWFVAELASAGFESEPLRFPHETTEARARPWPESFAVLTYIPLTRSDFYGADLLPELADMLPEVTFRIMGNGVVASRPNIEQLGFVSDPIGELERCVVLLRLTEHDAIAGTVREALATGRYALFGYDVPGVIQVDVRNVVAVADHLRRLRDGFETGQLPPNHEGIEYARSMSASSDALALARWIQGIGAESHGADS